MTATRRDDKSTEFGLWIRRQSEISSENGYLATNLDYIWHNYKTGEWMLIEEKRHNHQPGRWQADIFKLIDKVAKADPLYRGFHVLVFEKTSPEDGRMWLDHQTITRDQLIKFLASFKMPNP